MKARVHRIYYEELEEIIESLSDKIDELKSIENSEYETDEIEALMCLYEKLDEI